MNWAEIKQIITENERKYAAVEFQSPKMPNLGIQVRFYVKFGKLEVRLIVVNGTSALKDLHLDRKIAVKVSGHEVAAYLDPEMMKELRSIEDFTYNKTAADRACMLFHLFDSVKGARVFMYNEDGGEPEDLKIRRHHFMQTQDI